MRVRCGRCPRVCKQLINLTRQFKLRNRCRFKPIYSAALATVPLSDTGFSHASCSCGGVACRQRLPCVRSAWPVYCYSGPPGRAHFRERRQRLLLVVEGEYGLDRPNIVNPVVIYRMPPVVVPYPGRAALGPAYFPWMG